ncbi:hypothetical protein HID58_093867 [Brassica napus]|uniref:Uncharacterized protein n=1 Tax=Brassica napus TaxID=3708 RepID=A0ABQ7XBR8_BRANA|nr:hypothetical protein HID58_093866 [Brassica napus]KAH0852612.1 hypothetical protein HID58_093867 [Brassica napus]
MKLVHQGKEPTNETREEEVLEKSLFKQAYDRWRVKGKDLVLSLRMVIGVCAWLSQEDNTSLVDLEQHQKQALGVRTNGLRFMDPRQEDLEEKWL